MLKAGKQNRAVTQNLLLRSTEKHFSNANIYGCQDGILSRLQPKIAKGGANSFFRVQDAIERQGGKPSVANFAIHPDLGPYSVGKKLFCQTIAAVNVTSHYLFVLQITRRQKKNSVNQNQNQKQKKKKKTLGM